MTTCTELPILPWKLETWPKLASAIEGGREYVVWQMSPTQFQVAQRTPLNGLRQRKWLQRVFLPSWPEAALQAQQWAWAEAGIDIGL